MRQAPAYCSAEDSVGGGVPQWPRRDGSQTRPGRAKLGSVPSAVQKDGYSDNVNAGAHGVCPAGIVSAGVGRCLFRRFAGRIASRSIPRLAPWATFWRRCTAGTCSSSSGVILNGLQAVKDLACSAGELHGARLRAPALTECRQERTIPEPCSRKLRNTV